MLRWTLIGEYDGGTYIAQISAPNVDEAVKSIAKMNKGSFWESLANLDLDSPTPISGVENTWCVSGLFEDHLVLVRIVLTA